MFNYLWIIMFMLVGLIIIDALIAYFRKESKEKAEKRYYNEYLQVNGFKDSSVTRNDFYSNYRNL